MKTEQLDNPCHYKPFWEPEVTILVDVPDYDEEQYSSEHQIIIQEQYNEQVEHIRTELFLAGWRSAISLPYTSHPDGGLLVVEDLYLDWEILFYCGCDLSRGYQSFPTYPGFARPIPVNNGRTYPFSKSCFASDNSIFVSSCWLLWAEDFEDGD